MDSVVGVETVYGLDDLGIESRWERIFRSCPNRPRDPLSLLCNGYRVIPGGKAAGAWRYHPSPSRAEVKERVDLYSYSPSEHSWPVIGWALPFTYIFTLPVRAVDNQSPVCLWLDNRGMLRVCSYSQIHSRRAIILSFGRRTESSSEKNPTAKFRVLYVWASHPRLGVGVGLQLRQICQP
jgi:hypothetical protein